MVKEPSKPFRRKKKWQGATWTPENKSAMLGDGVWCRHCRTRHGYKTMGFALEKRSVQDKDGTWFILWSCRVTGNVIEEMPLRRQKVSDVTLIVTRTVEVTFRIPVSDETYPGMSVDQAVEYEREMDPEEAFDIILSVAQNYAPDEANVNDRGSTTSWMMTTNVGVLTDLEKPEDPERSMEP